jgi:hypothetical protein
MSSGVSVLVRSFSRYSPVWTSARSSHDASVGSTGVDRRRLAAKTVGDQSVLRRGPDVAGKRDLVARRIEDLHTTGDGLGGRSPASVVVCCALGCSAIATASLISLTK